MKHLLKTQDTLLSWPARRRALLTPALAILPFALWLMAAAPEEQRAPDDLPSFDVWYEKCAEVPSNRLDLFKNPPPRDVLPLPEYAAFEKVLQAAFVQAQEGPLGEEKHWLGPRPDPAVFFSTEATPGVEPPFHPFAQRLLLPPGSEVIIHGDLHGDIRSLVRGLKALNASGYMEGFKIAKPDTHLLFLGDYADRGYYGVEVLYTVLRLKLANPDRVWLVRGNHEDLRMIANYGFAHEGVSKYGRAFDFRKIARLYDRLPVVLYLGCENNVVQCNHGGMEPGYQPGPLLEAPAGVRFDLLGELKRQDFAKAHPDFLDTLPKEDEDTRSFYRLLYQNFKPTSPTTPDLLGFMWGDFSLQRHEPALRWSDERTGGGWRFGQAGTRLVLENSGSDEVRVRGVIRGHQHAGTLNPMMRRLLASRGVFRHWQESDTEALVDAQIPELAEHLERDRQRPFIEDAVYTLNVSPDSVYGKGCDFGFDTYLILRLEEDFEDWDLEVVNVEGGVAQR